MARHPSYPIFCCDREDRSTLNMFEDYREAEQSLELVSVEEEDYDAWDSEGYRLQLVAVDACMRPAWLRIAVASENPERNEEGLLDLVSAYAQLNGVEPARREGESLKDFYKRVDIAIGKRLWTKRPWWRRVFHLPRQ